MRKVLVMVGTALLLSSMQSQAASPENYVVKTTEDLFKLCSVTAGEELYQSARGFCLGFLEGAWSYHQALAAGASFNAIACPGPKVTRDDAAEVFVAWAKKHPELLETESPVHGVMRAVTEKWPCPR